jgi:hypothetical protein
MWRLIGRHIWSIAFVGWALLLLLKLVVIAAAAVKVWR